MINPITFRKSRGCHFRIPGRSTLQKFEPDMIEWANRHLDMLFIIQMQHTGGDI